jgi:hypothetical protein
MALVECRRFALYPQALVARSALEAAGVRAVVFDEHRATMIWTEQFSLNGIRVMVPAQELEAARELLSELDPPIAPTRGITAGGSSLLLMLLLLAGVAVGWPITGFRQAARFRKVGALVVTAIFSLWWLALWLRG